MLPGEKLPPTVFKAGSDKVVTSGSPAGAKLPAIVVNTGIEKDVTAPSWVVVRIPEIPRRSGNSILVNS
jgi:hypothetical protein